MNFCKDCKHFRPSLHMSPYGPWCASDEIPLDPIFGKKAIAARAARASGSQCGPEAKWFEPKTVKVSWFKRLFAA